MSSFVRLSLSLAPVSKAARRSMPVGVTDFGRVPGVGTSATHDSGALPQASIDMRFSDIASVSGSVGQGGRSSYVTSSTRSIGAKSGSASDGASGRLSRTVSPALFN